MRQKWLSELRFIAAIAGTVLLASTPWFIVLYIVDILGRIK